MAQVRVRVIEATNIPAADLSGYSDPYVTIQAGRDYNWSKKVYKTNWLKKTLHPVWNAMYMVDMRDVTQDRLKFIVFDHDTFTADDALGETNFPVNQLVQGVELDTWLPLTKAGRNRGQLHVGLTAMNFGKSAAVTQVTQVVQGGPPGGYAAPAASMQTTQTTVSSPGGYGAPAPGGYPPQPGYGAPAPGGYPPQPGYGAPPPQPGYGYGAPPPQPGYGAPSVSQTTTVSHSPAPGYGQGYGAPPPQPGYGYGAPPPQPSYGYSQPQATVVVHAPPPVVRVQTPTVVVHGGGGHRYHNHHHHHHGGVGVRMGGFTFKF